MYRNNKSFFEKVTPIKITEGRQLELYAESWGLLSDYDLESIKIQSNKSGITSSATIRVSDRCGQITCVIRGQSINLLFGLTIDEWNDVEKMCSSGQQLFYRYFKNGLSKQFCYEQKLLYSFCVSNKRNDVLVVRFRRCVNMRKNNRDDALLEILDIRKCDNKLFDVYTNHLRSNNVAIN